MSQRKYTLNLPPSPHDSKPAKTTSARTEQAQQGHQAQQLAFPLEHALPRRNTWGGSRKGAGRKPSGSGAVSHTRRPALASRFPVHISLSVESDLPSLRSPKMRRVIEDCFRRINRKLGLRLIHYSMQKHHLHLIVEATGSVALSKGMQGLTIRLARAINNTLKRKGRVFMDRYFARILKTPRQTRYCLVYVLNNIRKHDAQQGYVRDRDWTDPCSSALYFDGWARPVRAPPDETPPVRSPHTWLLTTGWRVHGLLQFNEVPGGSRRRRRRQRRQRRQQ